MLQLGVNKNFVFLSIKSCRVNLQMSYLLYLVSFLT